MTSNPAHAASAGALRPRPFALALLAVVLLLVAAPSAQAGKSVESVLGTQGAGNGQVDGPNGVAVRHSTGDVYVVDSTNRRVVRFGGAGVFERAWGWDVVQSGPGDTAPTNQFEICVPANGDVCKAGTTAAATGSSAGQFGTTTRDIAVDQTTGDVYVTNNNRVQKFDANGGFLRMWGRDVIMSSPTGGSTDLGNVAEVCTVAVDCKSAATGTLGGELNAGSDGFLAVDSTGNVYVSEATNRRISKFDSSGVFQRAWGWDVVTGGVTTYETCAVASTCKAASTSAGVDVGRFGSSSPDGLAVDSTGRVYAADSGNNRVQRFASDGSNPEIFAAAHLSGASSATRRHLAVDPTNDHVYVLRPSGSPEEFRIWEFDSSGALVDDSHAVGSLIPSGVGNGLAVNPSGGRLYLTTSNVVTGHHVVVLDDDGGYDPASATIVTPSDIDVHTATFQGTVNPNGADTSYRFEYSLDGSTWIPAGPSVNVGQGTSDIPVSQAVTGLEANRPYRGRIAVTTMFAGAGTSLETFFFTDPAAPEVTTLPAVQVSDTTAALRGRINANNMDTTYYFEYGTTTAYGKRVPVSDGDAGSAGVEQSFAESVGGLLSDVTYHYRLVATSAQGTTEGADRTFRTLAAIDPPAGRAYEMVTPANKNNRITGYFLDAEGVPAGLPGVPSTDGDSLLYSINHAILDPDAGVGFPHDKDAVLIRRGGDGWEGEAVHDVPGASGAAGAATGIVAASDDLETQAWRKDFALASGSVLSTKVFGNTTGIDGSGWYDWLPDPSVNGGFGNGEDDALIDGDGARLLRWGPYRGLLGPTDPSLAQLPSTGTVNHPGGATIYLQEPPGTGPRELVNECTGTVAGGDATEIPERDANGTSALPPSGGSAAALSDDLAGSQTCEQGSVTSRRGARAGGTTAMSEDGSRIFFVSPDSATAPPTSLPGLDGASTGAASCATVSGTNPNFVEHVGADTECFSQLFVRQYDSGGDPTVRWISRSLVAGQAVGLLGHSVVFEAASKDGETVYFRTDAPLTADDRNGTGAPGPVTTGNASENSWDLFRYQLPADVDEDPAGGTLTRISGGPSGEDPNTNCAREVGASCIDANAAGGAGRGAAARFVSDDGSKVYFATNAPIADAVNDAPDGGITTPGGTATVNSGARNIYLYDDSQIGDDRWKFVARVPFALGNDAFGNVDSCADFARGAASRNGLGEFVKFDLGCLHGTADGGLVAFESSAQLTEDDDDSAVDIYVYDASADELMRISAPASGQAPYDCGSGTSCNADLGFVGTIPAAGVTRRNVSEDGAIFFESRLELIPGDTNGVHYDTYMWKDGKLSLISPGSTDDHAFYSGISDDAEDVFFWTSQRIDPREIDDRDFDVYDARRGGGFPPPPPPPSDGCSALADGCQGAGAGAVGASDDTSRPAGDENVAQGARALIDVTRPGAKARRKAARTGVVRLEVVTATPGRVTAVAKARLRARKASVTRIVGRARLGVIGSGTLRLGLSRVARRELAAGRTLRLSVKVRQPGARPVSLTFSLRRAGR